MFSHVMVGTDDLAKAKSFYDALFATLGVGPAMEDRHRIFYISDTGIFAVSLPINGEPASVANGGTIAFACSSPEQVEKWHATGVANGAVTCEDAPGVRNSTMGNLYLAYLRDPSGNKLCALHRMA